MRNTMPNFIYRDLTNIERWVSDYESFVTEVADGYSMCIYEYTNDLGCRQLLEEHRSESEIQSIWRRVAAADTSLRAILRPTKKCIHGNYPDSWFWYWGCPPNSPELEGDLKSVGAL
jgi:hypothetical protein